MTARLLAAAAATLLLPALFASPLQAADDAIDAFRQPLPKLSGALIERYRLGRQLFETDWAAAPGPHPGLDGLGPLFDRLSCDGCHTRAGRGQPPQRPEFPMISMVVRLSAPGSDAHGGPLPHPLYGEQLDRNAVAGVPIEGNARVSYTERPGRYGDGTPYSLREPHYRFESLAFGPLGDNTLVSVRVAPALIGTGLLDAVPAQEIEAIAAEEKREGKVAGRPNRVWNIAAQALRVGRFGWKAGQPHLRQQNAQAFNRDIGITNPLYPENDCTPVEAACRAAAVAARHPKIGDDFLDAVTFYLAHLAPPAQRSPTDPRIARGAALFTEAGCAACHRPSLETGDSEDTALAHKIIHPYTDLLLHDLGEGLADGRPEFAAGGRSWRTAPLWGLGLVEVVNGHTTLLHDGRARNAAEAILWHGGEGERAKEAFRNMDADDRAALLAFLYSL
ncbi:MAG TPA: di-heme oxidoredictase family protein [Alphaproteobacteria bacterium]|nr:di-heme oxidoredictase family protein [Alphaproteobacteria bacterium]